MRIIGGAYYHAAQSISGSVKIKSQQFFCKLMDFTFIVVFGLLKRKKYFINIIWENMSALYFQVTYCSNGPKTINSNISTISVILDLASSEDHGRNSSHSLSVSLFLVLLKCCSKKWQITGKVFWNSDYRATNRLPTHFSIITSRSWLDMYFKFRLNSKFYR